MSSGDKVQAACRKGCAGPTTVILCCLAAAALSEPAAFFFFPPFALICGSNTTGTAVVLELASTEQL